MKEMIQLSEHAYILEGAVKIGLWVGDEGVYAIDSGGDKDAGKKVLKYAESFGKPFLGILNTHSHADHIGGNQLIQNRTNCHIYATAQEKPLIENPSWEATFLYGGRPPKQAYNKFLCAKPSKVTHIISEELPESFSFVALPGHSPEMAGILTDDHVFFIGDSVVSEQTMEKYHIFYLFDVGQALQTIALLKAYQSCTFVPSHSPVSASVKDLAIANEEKMQEIMQVILDICQPGLAFDIILEKIFEKYYLTMDLNQNLLVGSTVRSYLSYLFDIGRLSYTFQGHQMIWKTTV